MADAYWRYGDARHQAAAAAMAPPPATLKRPRAEYQYVPSGSDVFAYYPREDEGTAHPTVRDTESLGASYDRYLRNGISSYGAGESVRPVGGGINNQPIDDRRIISIESLDGRSAGYGGRRPEPPLPPDASNTLFVEGLPADCTRREVSHIFRPFVGFQEVRLVNKESRHPGADPLVLCFVDFVTTAQAAIALEALQGYKFDESDRESANLRLQFARFPGPRSFSGPRGRR
ncbi:unnamed protein product [Musa acuminata subsp. malaccensis]|uniref:(wild Malaysian banana) hypothetical protein n=1 Tax=Musa acuminata subsp. malaccensis TaxID=214687 RepID=A0A804IB70_MUSAM|nr:PREDICTED: RNA-binding protein 1 [Musa acuminata subsp. malaccensis]CAG1849915.1 unnamed protein product [Musa acuminata subsp. malaccensis]